MKLLKQHDGLCLLYSAAMLLDVRPEDLIMEIGHDGMKQMWLPDPRRVVHTPDEIQDCFVRRGFCLYQVGVYPIATPGNGLVPRPIWSEDQAAKRFEDHIRDVHGLLVGEALNGEGHAVAWDGEYIYDPRGRIYRLEDSESHMTFQYALLIGIKS